MSHPQLYLIGHISRVTVYQQWRLLCSTETLEQWVQAKAADTFKVVMNITISWSTVMRRMPAFTVTPLKILSQLDFTWQRPNWALLNDWLSMLQRKSLPVAYGKNTKIKCLLRTEKVFFCRHSKHRRTLYAWKSSMALETSNLRAIRNFTAVGWDTSPALCGCSLLRTSPRNSSTAWTDMTEVGRWVGGGGGVLKVRCWCARWFLWGGGGETREAGTSKIRNTETGIERRQWDVQDDSWQDKEIWSFSAPYSFIILSLPKVWIMWYRWQQHAVPQEEAVDKSSLRPGDKSQFVFTQVSGICPPNK